MSRIILLYKAGNELKRFDNDLTTLNHDDFKMTVESHPREYGTRFRIKIDPFNKIRLIRAKLIIPVFRNYNKMLVNGYQSWTQSKWMARDEKIRNLSLIGRIFKLSAYGDYNFVKTHGVGVFTSHCFTCLSNNTDSIFFGSLNRENAYTFFYGDLNHQVLEVYSDVKDLEIDREFYLYDLYRSENLNNDTWDDYFAEMEGPREPGPKQIGWTSWYKYYTEIDNKIIEENLNEYSKKKMPLNIFQIDDGYQKHVGDWLAVNKKFPDGMTGLSEKIRSAGYRSGIWLAPFICESVSDLYTNHPEWILKDRAGKPVVAGYNPGWSGQFYACDIYNEKFREYLQDVFKTIRDIWKYDMVKLDFLYAACLRPPHGKTRGMVMNDAVVLLEEMCRGLTLLGCGVPLESAFKRMEYCRIGSDVGPYWEDNKLKMIGYRERVSTRNSLLSTLAREPLNRRAFGNDPDVFYLRHVQNEMSKKQNKTLTILNHLFGSLVFTSDSVTDYPAEGMTFLQRCITEKNARINEMLSDGDLYSIRYELGDHSFQIYANLGREVHNIKPKDGELFDADKGRYINMIKIRPYETKIYLVHSPRADVILMGVGSNLPSVADIHISYSSSRVNIKDERIFKKPVILHFKSDSFDNLIINGKNIIKEKNGYFKYEIGYK